MASVLHGSARTTPRIRAELKAAQAPARLLASQYGLNVKTVLKWRNRAETTDARMGPEAKPGVSPRDAGDVRQLRRAFGQRITSHVGSVKCSV